MSTIKALNSEFKPKIVPIIRNNQEDVISSIQFPVLVQGMPEGIPILIRSGFIRTLANHPIVNMAIKGKLANIIRSSRVMKLTVEATVTYDKTPLSNNSILEKLLNLEDRGDNLKIVITDMVVEHSPNVMDYRARYNSIKNLFKPTVIGNCPVVIATAEVSSYKELEDQIMAYNALGYTKYRIASPKSKYIFGTPEELYSEGGIADIDSSTLFRGKLVEIIPRIINTSNKLTYVADTLHVEYEKKSVLISLEGKSILLTSKIWESRKELIGLSVIFSGIWVPKFVSPRVSKFIRFEKSK